MFGQQPLALALLAATVRGVVIPEPSRTFPLVARQSNAIAIDQSENDEMTKNLVSENQCRAYAALVHTDESTGVGLCTNFCGNQANASTNNGDFSSVSCLSTGQLAQQWYKGPDGHPFTVGQCECNLPLVDTLVKDFVIALPAIGQVACEVLMDSWEAVLTKGLEAIPGEGAGLSAATRILVTAAKAFAGKADESGFFSWLNDQACGSSNFTQEVDQATDQIASAWDALTGAPASITSVFSNLPHATPTGSSTFKPSTSLTVGGSASATPTTSHGPTSTTASTKASVSSTGATTTKPSATSSSPTSSYSAPSVTFSEAPDACSTAPNSKRNVVQRNWPVPSNAIPSDAQSQQLVQHLQAWIKAGYPKSGADFTAALQAAHSYMRAGVDLDNNCVFYAGADGGDAANSALQLEQGKVTVGTAFYGYNVFPFDPCVQPRAAMDAADKTAGNTQVLVAWFRITSIAFAQACSGIVYYVDNAANWKTSKGSGGQPSIFVQDEAPALIANSGVTEIYQTSTGAAELWEADTAPALRVVANNADVETTSTAGNVLPAFLIYYRADNYIASD